MKLRQIDRTPWMEWAWVSDQGNPLGTVDVVTFRHVVFARNAIRRAMRRGQPTINRPR